MKRESVVASALLTCLLLPAARAAEVNPHLEPMSFLAGPCWSAAFPDGHAVRGNGPEYRGEALYAWQPARSRIEYHYFDSSGGYSSGHVATGPLGSLEFLDDHYVAADGSVLELQSRLELIGETGYRKVSRAPCTSICS